MRDPDPPKELGVSSGEITHPEACSLPRNPSWHTQPSSACNCADLQARISGNPQPAKRTLVQGNLAHEKQKTEDSTVALCLGTYGDPIGVGVSYERGTPVGGGGSPSRRVSC